MSNLKLKLVAVVTSLSLIATVYFGLDQYRLGERIKFDGPLNELLLESKDFIADILPPPGYVIELDRAALRALQPELNTDREKFAANYQQHKADYQKSFDRWQFELDLHREDHSSKSSVVSALEPFVTVGTEHVNALFAIIENEFIPAIEADKLAIAREVYFTKLQPAFESHRQVILTCVKEAVQHTDVLIEEVADETNSFGNARFYFTSTCLASIIGVFLLGCHFFLTVRSTMTSVRGVTQALRDATLKLNNASSEIGEGGEAQAQSLLQVVQSLEEITQSANHSASKAHSAQEFTSRTQEVTSQAKDVMQATIKAMNDINASTSQIRDIVTTVDELAFQTNLLALNASIEAARAGQHGRGFSVVAAEVRELALRSAKSAGEIRKLIDISISKVENGTKLVNNSGASLQEIDSQVASVSCLVEEITTTTKHQLSRVDAISNAISNAESVTNDNLSESRDLSKLVQILDEHTSNLERTITSAKA